MLVSKQIRSSGLAVVVGFLVGSYETFIHTFIVMQQNGRDVKAIRARHAVFAVVAWDSGVSLQQPGCLFKEVEFVF